MNEWTFAQAVYRPYGCLNPVIPSGMGRGIIEALEDNESFELLKELLSLGWYKD